MMSPGRRATAGRFYVAALELFKDWKSVICGVLRARGAPETLAKGGGRSLPRVSGAPGAAQTPKMSDLQSLNSLEFLNQAKVQPRHVCHLRGD